MCVKQKGKGETPSIPRNADIASEGAVGGAFFHLGTSEIVCPSLGAMGACELHFHLFGAPACLDSQ